MPVRRGGSVQDGGTGENAVIYQWSCFPGEDVRPLGVGIRDFIFVVRENEDGFRTYLAIHRSRCALWFWDLS